MYVNEIRLSGKASTDAERRGNGPVRFTIQQGGGRKKDSAERWPVEFFDVMAWLPEGEAALAVKRGDFVAVSGRLRHSEYSGKDGSKRRRYEVVATSIGINKPEPPLTPSLCDVDIPF